MTGKSLFPIGEGGGETVAHDLLCGLAAAGKTVSAWGAMAMGDVARLNDALRQLSADLTLEQRQQDISTTAGRSYQCTDEMRASYCLDYPAVMSFNEHFLQDVRRHLSSRRPSMVLTQAELSPQLCAIARAAGIFTILYVHNGMELDAFASPEEIGLVLANSRFFQQRIQQKHQLRCELLYPAVRTEKYLVENNTHEFITMINPVPVKGIGQLMQLALAMPQRRFLVVEGWGTPPHILEVMGKLPNITYMQKQLDMREVYRRTHLLLVPSQWEEAFGRVVVEAQVSGIPVVASAVGGLPESVGQGGVLVGDFRDWRAWRTAVAEAEARYDELSEKARDNARHFCVEAAVHRFMEIVASL